MTIDQWLEAARTAGLERQDARWLLGAVLGQPASWLIAHGEEAVPPEFLQRAREGIARCAAGEPLAYVLGEQVFHGLALEVSPAVLVPRSDTETLVGWALELLPAGQAANVLDLGTGSGAVALALARERLAARVTGVDLSPAALEVARRNAERHGLPVRWLQSDWFSALDGERFDLVVGNPPYIAEGDPHLEALGYEPPQALSSGADGLDAIRRIVAGAPHHLQPGGWLLLEHGHQQAEAVCDLLTAGGFLDASTRRDLAGRPRCSGGCRGLGGSGRLPSGFAV